MKVSIKTSVICPKCKQIMLYAKDLATLSCENTYCEQRGRKFKAPVVNIEIEPVKEVK